MVSKTVHVFCVGTRGKWTCEVCSKIKNKKSICQESMVNTMKWTLSYAMQQPLKTTNYYPKKLNNPVFQIKNAITSRCSGKEPALFPRTHSRLFSGRNATGPEWNAEIERKSSIHDRRICDRLRSLETNQHGSFCRVCKLDTPWKAIWSNLRNTSEKGDKGDEVTKKCH